MQCGFEVFVILDGEGIHPKGSRHLCSVTDGASTAPVTTLHVSIETFHLLGAIREEKDFRFPHLLKDLKDGEEVMRIFFIESMREEVHFLNGFPNRPDQMVFSYPRNDGSLFFKEGSDDPLDMGRGGLRILKKTFQIEDGPFGIGEEITRDEQLMDDPCFGIDGNGYSDQSAWCPEKGGYGFSSRQRFSDLENMVWRRKMV